MKPRILIKLPLRRIATPLPYHLFTLTWPRQVKVDVIHIQASPNLGFVVQHDQCHLLSLKDVATDEELVRQPKTDGKSGRKVQLYDQRIFKT